MIIPHQPKIALVHDFLLYPGGAEHVLRILAEMYPEAPIYTLLHDTKQMGGMFADRDVRTSFLQKWPRWIRRRHKWLLPFFASAVESFDLREYDLVISSSGAWSKGLVVRLETMHIAYIHSPMRYVWDENERYLAQQRGKKRRWIARQFLSYLRVWDYEAAQRPDVLVANAQYTKERIAKYYRRDAHVVYPSAPTLGRQSTSTKRTHFTIIGRLSPYKNTALAIDVCNKLSLPLVVVGDGSERKKLAKLAGPTVEFRGYVDDVEKARILDTTRALLFPCEDDFGLVCVEALVAGVPVITLNRGGAAEIVRPGRDGELCDAPTVELFADALRRFLAKEGSYVPEELEQRAALFSRQEFETGMRKIVAEHMSKS